MDSSTHLQTFGFCGSLANLASGGDNGPRYLTCENKKAVETSLGDAPVSTSTKPEEAESRNETDLNDHDAAGQRNAIYSSKMKERKDEIDALRARVDVILNKMVQSSGDDVQELRQKLSEMRGSTPKTDVSVATPRSAPATCPLSPMTAMTAMTATTGASATPSADTELHANLTSSRRRRQQLKAAVDAKLLPKSLEIEGEDDDEEEDEAKDASNEAEETDDEDAFNFNTDPLLSNSKSLLMSDIGSVPSRREGFGKDPPATIKHSESLLPDPGGDESYCSEDGRSPSPPNTVQLLEAATDKVDAVVSREGTHDVSSPKSNKSAPDNCKNILGEQKEALNELPSKEQTKQESKELETKNPKKKEPDTNLVSKKSNTSDQENPVTADPPQKQNHRSMSPPPPVENVDIPTLSFDDKGEMSDFSKHTGSPPSPSGDITVVEEVNSQRIRDPYGDKGCYTGILVKKKPHGRGSMKYDDGRFYEGHWNHGRWHGVGRAIFANHDVFEGTYDMDQRHGHGMYQWNDGRVYTGQFYQDQRQGRGTYTWPDGAVYQGEFKAGHRHGQGMYRFADGSVYTGEWKNGKYDGVGECRWADGRSYRGEWRDGRANGYGVETRPNGAIRHDGEWKDDRPVRNATQPANDITA